MPSPSTTDVVTGKMMVSAKPAWIQDGKIKPVSLMAAAPSSRGKQWRYERDNISMLPHRHSGLKSDGLLQSLLRISSRICIFAGAATGEKGANWRRLSRGPI